MSYFVRFWSPKKQDFSITILQRKPKLRNSFTVKSRTAKTKARKNYCHMSNVVSDLEPGKVLPRPPLVSCPGPALLPPQLSTSRFCGRCSDDLVSLVKHACILSLHSGPTPEIYSQTCCDHIGWGSLDSNGQSHLLDKRGGRMFCIQYY